MDTEPWYSASTAESRKTWLLRGISMSSSIGFSDTWPWSGAGCPGGWRRSGDFRAGEGDSLLQTRLKAATHSSRSAAFPPGACCAARSAMLPSPSTSRTKPSSAISISLMDPVGMDFSTTASRSACSLQAAYSSRSSKRRTNFVSVLPSTSSLKAPWHMGASPAASSRSSTNLSPRVCPITFWKAPTHISKSLSLSTCRTTGFFSSSI
mmetsp:Transcript_37226/g.105075  ORF Transcript_37226/g.105075 Transcript_37226/m.105075 type:complete len:208 (-) Transcript_37226:692-1315(-)